jgi:hypothetical protein
MNGFGFIEYKDAMDARDVVPGEPPTLSSHLSPTTGLFVLFANHAGALAFRTLTPYPPWKYRPSYPASLANDMLKMDPTLWANVSRSSSRAAPATVNRLPAPAPVPAEDTTTIATAPQGRAAHRIACRSVDFPMIPAGRSVKLSHFVFHRHSYWIHPLEGLERAISLAPMDSSTPPPWFGQPVWTAPLTTPQRASGWDGRLPVGILPRGYHLSVLFGSHHPTPRHFPGSVDAALGSRRASKPETLPAMSPSSGTLGFTGLDCLFAWERQPRLLDLNLHGLWLLGSERLRPPVWP